jgi:CelD/BcsL family acetyltransferase involved in cellulose biosynthesis
VTVKTVTGRVIEVKQRLSDGDRRAWAELAGRAVEPNPFHEPSCVIPAAQHQTFGDEIQLVVAEEDGRFLACLPIRHVRTSWRQLSYQTATTRVRRMNYLGTPLIDPERGVEATAMLLQTLVEECRSQRSDTAELWDVTAGGPTETFLQEAAAQIGLPIRVKHSFDRGILGRQRLDQEGPSHSARTLRTLRSKQRGLSRATGTEVVLVDRFDEDAISEYIRLEASGYKAQTGVAMTTVTGEPEYFTDMCRGFADSGRLHLLSLQAGAEPAAMMAWIEADDSIFQFKWSYDDGYAKYSPGLQLHMAAIEHFRTNTQATLLDTCTDENNEFVFGMYPHRRTLRRYEIGIRDGLRHRATVKLVGDGGHLRKRLARRLARRSAGPPRPGFQDAGA